MTDKRRTIHSFVRRQGRLTTSQRRALLELWQDYGIDVTDQPLVLADVFGDCQSIVLEIGFGNGDSLCRQAQAHPHIGYLGIEVYQPGVGRLLNQLADHQLTNVKLICEDAVTVLQHNIPTGSLDGVQIFFPDPWPKKRHHKRRLIQPAFIDLLVPKLTATGCIHLATDWPPYAQQMLTVLEAHPQLVNGAAEGGYYPRPTQRPLTKFEQRGERLGHPVFDLLFQRA
ncbi:MAG: tRNA (guanosine(46)-N7)-methyltransferase TrmB [Legionellales bacterium]|nr:tRNA (guanosine(46)-N7)-methyltransferase TrmB [Legionellales bacterium]